MRLAKNFADKISLVLRSRVFLFRFDLFGILFTMTDGKLKRKPTESFEIMLFFASIHINKLLQYF